MINLTEIKTTKRSYRHIESEVLIIGLFQDKKLSPHLQRLDEEIEHKLLHAIQLDGFSGKKIPRFRFMEMGPLKEYYLLDLVIRKIILRIEPGALLPILHVILII